MEERTVSSSAVFQRLIPALSAAFAQIRRSPGKDHRWIDSALKNLERERPSSYARLRRRLGFSLRLCELAGLDLQDRAIMTLGIFFHELVADIGAKARHSRPWMEYLLRNEPWLAPSYEVAEALQTPGWGDATSRAVVAAKVTLAFDVETLERHERPLQILQQMFSETHSDAAEQVIPVLWTEEGQELCDHHFRRQPYRLDVQEIRHSFEALQRVVPRISLDEPAAPMRFSGPAAPAAQPAPSQEPSAAPAAPATPAPAAPAHVSEPEPSAQGAGFDRRREQLRAGPGWGAILGDVSKRADGGAPEQVDEAAPAPEPIAAPQPERIAQTEQAAPAAPQEAPAEASQSGHTPAVSLEQVLARGPAAAPPTEQEEEPAMTMRAIPSTRTAQGDAAGLVVKVEQLRAQLERIERSSAEAQQVLGALAPQIEQFSAWVAELEAVVGRFHPRDQQAA